MFLNAQERVEFVNMENMSLVGNSRSPGYFSASSLPSFLSFPFKNPAKQIKPQQPKTSASVKIYLEGPLMYFSANRSLLLFAFLPLELKLEAKYEF